ncbi:hypothetical protein BS17DRAFT_792043 [Gyrodon lividus]|nr:hypothetical protein BS17DRAFT_792043 [Gyrodon lividus]
MDVATGTHQFSFAFCWAGALAWYDGNTVAFETDSEKQLTRRDITTLLIHGDLALARARAKTANLMQEDVMGGLFGELGMLVGVVGGAWRGSGHLSVVKVFERED